MPLAIGLSLTGTGLGLLLAAMQMTMWPSALRAILAAVAVVLIFTWPLSVLAVLVRNRSRSRMTAAVVVIVVGAVLGGVAAGVAWRFSEREQTAGLRELYRKSANPAAEQIDIVAQNLERHLRPTGGGGLGSDVARLLVYPRGRLNVLREQLNPDWITRDDLVAFYRAYQDLVGEIQQIGISSQYDFTSDGNYTLWKRYDSEFMKSMHDLMATDAYRALHEAISRHKWPDRGERDYWA